MSLGFDPTTVFNRVGRKKARKTKRKKTDDMEDMINGAFDGGLGLGVETFSLARPEIDPLGIGEDFGERILAPAGKPNAAGRGGFLGIIGSQQLDVPPIIGRRAPKPIGAKRRKKRKTPLQKRTGSTFGDVDEKFGKVLFSNIEGARERIRSFREGRRVKEEAPEMPELEERERPALPEKIERLEKKEEST